MRTSKRIIFVVVAALIALGGGQVQAQDAMMVTLKSLSGDVVIVGELQAIEAGYYTVLVEGFGVMRVRAALVSCQTQSTDCSLLTVSS